MLIAWCILGLVFYHNISNLSASNPYYMRKRGSQRTAITVKENEFPFIIGIYHNPVELGVTIPKCLGIIVSQYSVLTTATCLSDRWGNSKAFPRSFAVRYDIREGCELHDPYLPRIARNIVYHPLNDFDTKAADLAYLVTYTALMSKEADPPTKEDLNAESNTTKSKDYMKIPEVGTPADGGERGISCIFFGFVKTMVAGKEVHRLSYREITLSRMASCMRAYGGSRLPLSEDKICGGFPARGLVPTLNDSGGPLMCKHAEWDYKLFGLVSYASENGTLPGNYINITIYKNFIDEARKAGENIYAIFENSTDKGYREKLNIQKADYMILSTIFIVFILMNNI